MTNNAVNRKNVAVSPLLLDFYSRACELCFAKCSMGRQMQFFLNFCFLKIKFKQLQNLKLDLMKNAQLSPVGVKYISAQNCIIMHTTKTVRKNFYAEIVIQLRRP